MLNRNRFSSKLNLSKPLIGNVNIKGRSFVQFAGGRNKAIVVFHYFLYDGKPDACALILFFTVKALEYFEDLFFEFGLKADAIVRELDVAVASVGR